ncbi:MAG: tetratricopeptide repeat protein [Leptolyngbyaceae cyanobacterium SM1_1_3]|nr:tetratricopeptide repeat protein [Leptolyngbyaceae cyanobacterium SM1_1_3]NJN03607.1 tetratricopeptide repeat protein [Leptolyngbyaceae cyanobacterium RM1_1_2]NJO12000.1 tetratricopeptide repeat protein [Leptolyngbyaceae cyanobacterium SL_1_1]
MAGSCRPTAATPFSSSIAAALSRAPLAYPPFLIDAAAADFYRQRGLEYRGRQNFERAIAALKTSVALDPYNSNGYVVLGWTEHLAGQENAAAQTLQQALQQDADTVPALNALGIVYLVSGDLQAAVKAHTRAAELQPDNEIAYYNLSLAYQRLQDYDAAIQNALKATELEPSNPHPWVALAIAYWSQQATSAAQQAYQQAIALDGRYRDRAFLAHLIKAGFSSEQVEITSEVLADR